ncbi:NADH-quinone oxidoreductase subunit L [Infirmifilum lucidum]|uniref:NADH-quinone oxidoreductase subunit L n=1 Tax=Infirmifilum lucidum TaxID=2776706 RepID=A0A7L9FKH8_9CREN|nr:NADH-quinone oxidoreductase subunit L [Infirmifilum lucidum]QOJ79315.1 NADH-quinone oxidoreductase subunit L [Infirmifilum lucidum]
MQEALVLAWLAPYLATAAIIALNRASWRVKSLVSITAIFASAIASAVGLLEVARGHEVRVAFQWVKTLGVNIGVLFDGLSSLMAVVVSWLSFLIAVYSHEYMRGEGGETRYWLFFTFFVGSMMLLVLSDNLLAMFIGWEGTGLASYALIGHWFTDEEERWVGDPGRRALGVPMWFEPSHSGLRALVFTRLGDVGMIFGVATLHTLLGTTLLATIAEGAWATSLLARGVLPVFLWLLFLGAIAKSAQFPFHEWLVTAMTGPTSVSALIHAATMVKAGVYFLLRFAPVLVVAHTLLSASGAPQAIPSFLEGLALLGALTAFMMATMALVSRELKLILAYSTASQLGYMFMGVAVGTLALGSVGGLVAGFAHLMSHAVFKATLFLAAGAVIHAVHSRFIDDMGGLASSMKLTALAFLLATLSLSGIPPFAGFWTKDEIIHLSAEAGLLAPTVLAVVTAGLTATYSARAFARVFSGKRHELHAHEPGLAMLAPYLTLGFLSLALGLAWPLVGHSLEALLEHTLGAVESHQLLKASPLVGATEATLVLALLGFSATLYLYAFRGWSPYVRVKGSELLYSVYSFLYDRWLINSLYYRFIVAGAKQVSSLTSRLVDTGIVDRFYHRLLPTLFARLSGIASRLVEASYDSLLHVRLVGLFKGLWSSFRKMQTGRAPHYLIYFWLGASVVLLLLAAGWFKW